MKLKLILKLLSFCLIFFLIESILISFGILIGGNTSMDASLSKKEYFVDYLDILINIILIRTLFILPFYLLAFFIDWNEKHFLLSLKMNTAIIISNSILIILLSYTPYGLITIAIWIFTSLLLFNLIYILWKKLYIHSHPCD